MDSKGPSRRGFLDNDVVRWGCWFAMLNVIDGAQTMSVVARVGVGAEGNPWIGWLIQNYSFEGLWLAKLSIMAVVLALSTRLSLSVLRGVSLGLATIVILNFMTCFDLF